MDHRAKWASSGLVGCFQAGLERNPQGTALEVAGESVSYEELAGLVAYTAQAIRERAAGRSAQRIGVVATETVQSYASVLGILAAGHSYVPLNPAFPADRNAYILENAELDWILADVSAAKEVEAFAKNSKQAVSMLWTRRGGEGDGLDLAGHPPASELSVPAVTASDIAYTMFTSGSTGMPKGVEITHGNIGAYIDYMLERYELGPEDRFTQLFEKTFDLSLFDLFVCWAVGGTLCVVPHKNRMAPAKFVREQAVTVWFSVPSVANMMARLGALKEGAYPSLRLSLFCGEALTASVTEQWAKAAPNSIVENLYGPTEATVACAYFRWERSMRAEDCFQGVVPIGKLFPGHDYVLLDPESEALASGEEGEFCICGPQVCPGYLKRPELNAVRFVERDGRRYYRTGDLVKAGSDDELLYLGRTDFQIKIRGYRIELGEIENVLREVCGAQTAAVLCINDANGQVKELAAFVDVLEREPADVLAAAAQKLPDYMVPKQLLLEADMPLNVNGKVDRKKLGERLAKL